MLQLSNKQIVLGITGGIAAYKAAELVRVLQEAGATVRVVMTRGATAFITPLTLQALSGQPVHLDLLDPDAEAAMGHIELARWADLILVAPASANFMARLANGEADELLTTVCLASTAPIALAPAMNQAMWRNEQTQSNREQLLDRGIHLFGPAEGLQACGDIGPGRMMEPTDIAAHAAELFQTGILAGQRVIITAGPTREAIDPVRYLSNNSSGKMGFALAEAASEAGASTCLVAGPVNLETPERVERINVSSAQEMLDAVMEQVDSCSIFIAAAAVADYRPEQAASQKIKKSGQSLQLNLVPNPDIVASVAGLAEKPFTVGFAAETENLVANARDKLQRKNLDMVIANDVSDKTIGFDSDNNAVTLVAGDTETVFAETSKRHLARQLIKAIAQQLQGSSVKS
jgi:phosphopantothenoylcysteine decarboxylase/phosphopantothenate--cysteine ligase